MLGIHRVLVDDRPIDAVYMNLAGFKFVDTRQTFDQRGFAGTVLTHQCPYLAFF